MNITEDLLHRLPKAELHVHLDGSLRPSTLLELAAAGSIDLPAKSSDALKKLLHCGENTGSLVEYLKAFDTTLRVLQTRENLERAAFELAEDAARENVRYLEVRYCPALHLEAGLALIDVQQAVADGLARARKQFGIRSGVIVCGLRHVSPEAVFEMARFAAESRELAVVAFDLAGAEQGFPAKNFKPAFEQARMGNLSITIHAGEADGANSIAQAIHLCGAERIGHGCRLVEDPELERFVVDHQIALECCPSSNVQTGAVARFEEHPLKAYLERGARVTVSTDNRFVSDTTLTRELWRCHRELGLSASQLKAVILNGFEAAFLPWAEKRALVDTIGKELATALG